jgi:hypothetical protein
MPKSPLTLSFHRTFAALAAAARARSQHSLPYAQHGGGGTRERDGGGRLAPNVERGATPSVA